MREVFVHQDHARVGLYKSMLEVAGIATFVRNETCNNSMSEMPTPLFFPSLCVVNDADYDEAMRVLGDIFYGKPSNAPDWKCVNCGEEVPATFDSCWKCGQTPELDPSEHSSAPEGT